MVGLQIGEGVAEAWQADAKKRIVAVVMAPLAPNLLMCLHSIECVPN